MLKLRLARLTPVALLCYASAALLVTGCLEVAPDGSLQSTSTGTTSTTGTTGNTGTTGTTGTQGGPIGNFSYNQQTGDITGYAYDPYNTSQVFTVEFYLDFGVNNGGTLVGSGAANGFYNGLPVAAGFNIQPSSSYINGTPHKLYGYMIRPGTNTPILIGTGPMDFFAGPSPTGFTYFTNNVASVLQTNCNSCHSNTWNNYYTARLALGTNSPISGGTATNNQLYLKATGSITHGGGNRCSGTCATLLTTWWGDDFGH